MKVKNTQLSKRQYLKDGAGNPWALHDSSNGLFSSLVIDMLFMSLANAGAFEPIGSRKTIQLWLAKCGWIWKKKENAREGKLSAILYLKIGTGKACAWQSKAKAEFSLRSNVLDFDSDEKTGALKPTGSGDGKNVNKHWDREALRIEKDERWKAWTEIFFT